MPLAPVDSLGTVLHYRDSGAPPGSTDYTTLVLSHGIYFNSGIYGPMIPYAAQNNLRLILLDSRDNGESTPYTADELTLLRSTSKEDQEHFLKDLVLEYARFLEWFIEHEKPIPPKENGDGKRTGGVSLVFWSGGNGMGVGFFAYADLFPQRTREVLEKYLRSHILYDAAPHPLGLTMPPQDELYNPTRDPDFPPERLALLFLPGLVGHHNNDGPLTRKAFLATKLDDLPPQRELCQSLTWEPVPEEVNAGDFASATELETLRRSALPILLLNREIYKACTERFVYDAEFAEAYFPKVTVECVVAWRSLSETVYGMYALKKMILKREAEGGRGRRFRWHNFEGANHMWHWWKPEATAKLFASL